MRRRGRATKLWDRTDAIGPDGRRRSLLDYLDARVGYTPHQKARQLLERGELSWSQDTAVTLYDDDVVLIAPNPRRSFGYLYVGAWFKADLPLTEPMPSSGPPNSRSGSARYRVLGVRPAGRGPRRYHRRTPSLDGRHANHRAWRSPCTSASSP